MLSRREVDAFAEAPVPDDDEAELVAADELLDDVVDVEAADGVVSDSAPDLKSNEKNRLIFVCFFRSVDFN